MKATGIVRRIDDLGRVVIPKEIRRTMRIREGDPLEIYTNNDGEVIFKKYSSIGEIASFAGQHAEVLNKMTGLPALICDRDHVIAAAGASKKELLERRITPVLEEMIHLRKATAYDGTGSSRVKPVDGFDFFAEVCCPILVEGDIAGSIVLLAGEDAVPATEVQMKLAQVSAALLGKQLES